MSKKRNDRNPWLPLEKGDFYYNEKGFIVFTAQYLTKRGYCCESGCRHCPYGYKHSKSNS